jgi:hypothetical protein
MRKLSLLVVCLVLVSVVLLGAACGSTKVQEGAVVQGSETGGSTIEGMTQDQLVQLIQKTISDMNLKGDKGDTGAQGLQGVQGPAGVQGPKGGDTGNSILPTPIKFTLDPTSGYDSHSEKLSAGDLVVVNTIDMGFNETEPNGNHTNWVSVLVQDEEDGNNGSLYEHVFTPQMMNYGAGWIRMGFGFVILVPFDGTYRFELTVDQTKGPPVPVPVTIYHLAQLWQ